MTIVIILFAMMFLILLSYVSPKIAKKMFPVPPLQNETINVYFPHGLEAGNQIKVGDELLEVVNVNGGQLTVKQVV